MRNQRQRATMKDVAQVARVSPKTVSNVLTGSAQVRESTRARVEAAMAELDFVPNLSARGLRNGRAGVVGVALPDLSTAFSAALTRSVVQHARRRDLAVQIEDTGADPRREFELVSRARSHLIDGLILNPVSLEDSVVEHVGHLPPVVLIGEVEQHRVDRVFIDTRAKAAEVTAHLISRGARRIAVIGGGRDRSPGNATSRLRYQGHLDALAQAGISAEVNLEVATVEWSSAGGADGMERLLQRGVAFDAVAAFTDSLALGALHQLHERGVVVPQDVLVTGFDNVELAAFSAPGLTTMNIDVEAYVAEAFALLDSRMAGEQREPQAVEIPCSLVVRGSTDASPRGYQPG